MSDFSRPEIDATDYLGNQKKKLALADRRPARARASDIVGPGIASQATRVVDWDDPIVTYNGYYSSVAGANSAPNNTDDFVGFVVSDGALGGTQVLFSLDTGGEYRRRYLRNPGDPSLITWLPWDMDERAPARAQDDGTTTTVSVPSGPSLIPLTAPGIDTFGTPGAPTTYQRATDHIKILRPGSYSGFVRLGLAGGTASSLVVSYPNGSGTAETTLSGINGPTAVPLDFRATDAAGMVSVRVVNLSGSTASYTWSEVKITRVGDA